MEFKELDKQIIVVPKMYEVNRRVHSISMISSAIILQNLNNNRKTRLFSTLSNVRIRLFYSSWCLGMKLKFLNYKACNGMRQNAQQ